MRHYGHVTVPTSTWQRIAHDIAAQIRSGATPVGSRIPAYRQLADQFGTSLGSVRRAVEYLTGLGVVRGHAGSGVYVLRVPTIEELNFSTVTTEEIVNRLDGVEESLTDVRESVGVLQAQMIELYAFMGRQLPSAKNGHEPPP